MPTDKDFKRLVRGRMQKTGESYTSARAHLRQQKPATRMKMFWTEHLVELGTMLVQ